MRYGKDKLMDLPTAVAKLVKPGMSIALGCSLEGFIPYAAAHEIIRQGMDRLTVVGPISNICVDQLIGAGRVERVIAAWIGNVSTGSGYNFRRAVEKGRPAPVEVINHSNFSITLALEAGARGLPMAVSRSPLGSDIIKDNPHFKIFACPHSGQKLLAIQAVNPDLAIIHVQRADRLGNAQAWSALGFAAQATQAAAQVLVTCEEIVDPEVIRSDPDRTVVPGMLVDAVCEVPWGAHPAPVQGYYDLDGVHYVDYSKQTKDEADAAAWLEEWVYSVPNREAYLAKLGGGRMAELKVSHPAPTTPVEYGW